MRAARAHDPLDLGDGVDAGVAGAVVVAQLVAEVDAAGQLAHDQQVDAGQSSGRSGEACSSFGLTATGRRLA